MGDVEYRGGSANVLKLECGGRQIAVKALRARDLSLQEMKNVSRSPRDYIVADTGELSARFAEVLQGSYNLEVSPTFKRVAVARGSHDGEPVCHGVRVDDKRQHQRVYNSASRCESLRAREFSTSHRIRDCRSRSS